MTKLFSCGDISAVRLTKTHIPALQTLYDSCSDYYTLVGGQPAEAHEAADDMVFHPKARSENVVPIGLFTPTGSLVGMLLTLRDYPKPTEWYIGLFLLAPEQRERGLGRQLIVSFETWLISQGARKVLLAVVQANTRAEAFWQSNGFTIIRSLENFTIGLLSQTVVEYEKALD